MSGGGRGRRSRRGHGGGGGGGGGHGGGDARWLVTYADLLTLLMVLFLVLWVISTIDLKKFEQFKQGLGDFGNPAAAEAAEAHGVGSAATGVGPANDGDVGAAGETTTTIAGEDGAEPGADAPPPELSAAELEEVADDVQETVAGAGIPDDVTVRVEERGLVVSIVTDDVLFESASAAVTPAGEDVIGLIAPALTEIGNHIIVEGHTDNRPLRRQGYDNWDLSVDRAVSVIKMLRDSFGVSPERLAASGYGDQRPVAQGSDAGSLARNRRVEIVVLAGPEA